MALFDKLRPLFKPPVVEMPVQECADCGTRIHFEEEACPECGGEITDETHEVPVHWSGLD